MCAILAPWPEQGFLLPKKRASLDTMQPTPCHTGFLGRNLAPHLIDICCQSEQ